MLVTQFQGPLSTLSHEEPRLDIMDGASSSAFHFQCLLEDLQATGMGFSELHCSSDEMDNKYVGFVDKVTHPSEPVPFSAQCSTSLKDIMSMYDYRSEFPQIKDVYKPDIDNIKDSILLRPENPMLSSSCVAEEAPTSPSSLSTWKEADTSDISFDGAQPEDQNATEHIPTIVAAVIESSNRVAKDATASEYHSAAQEAVMQKQGEPCRRKIQAKRQKRVEKGMKQTASSALHQSSLQQVQAQGQMASSSSASFNQGGAICIFQPDHDYSKRATDEGHPQSIVVVHESNGILSRTLPAQVNVLMVSSAQTNRGDSKKRSSDSCNEDGSSPEKGAKRGRQDQRERERRRGRNAEKKLAHSQREAERRGVTRELYDGLKETLNKSLASTNIKVPKWSKLKLTDTAALRIMSLEVDVRLCAMRTQATLHRALGLRECDCTCGQCKSNFGSIDADLLGAHEEVLKTLKPYSR